MVQPTIELNAHLRDPKRIRKRALFVTISLFCIALTLCVLRMPTYGDGPGERFASLIGSVVCIDDKIQAIRSPDGRFEAKVFDRDCEATEHAIQVRLHDNRAWGFLGDETLAITNAFVTVKWKNDRTLVILLEDGSDVSLSLQKTLSETVRVEYRKQR